MPTRPAPSAFLRAPRWQPGAGCTRPSHGTMRPPITASRRAGTTGCATTGIGSSPSASCISARPTDDNGFSEEILPLHVLEGKGDLIGMLREPPAARGSMPALAASAGPGRIDLQRLRSRHHGGSLPMDCHRRAAREREAMGAVRVARAAAFSADCAARVLRALSAGAHADAPALRRGGTSAPPCRTGAQVGHELRRLLRRRAGRPARDRLLLCPRQLPRRQYRQDPRSPRCGGARRVDPGDLHVRPRRQSRLPGPVGQVGDVRGVACRSAGHGRRRHPLRPGRRHAGLAGRLLQDRARGGRLPAPASRPRSPLVLPVGDPRRGAARSQRSCRSITPPDRSPALS